MKSFLPWLVALPDSVGDAVVATCVLNKITNRIGHRPGIYVLCTASLVPIFGDHLGISKCLAYGAQVQTEIHKARFEWAIDLSSTEASRNVLQHASCIHQAFRFPDNPLVLQVADNVIPASSFNRGLEGRAASPHEPAWALEGDLVAQVLKENLWDWVAGGAEPMFHFRTSHNRLSGCIPVKRPYVVLLPCGYPPKHWPMERFVKLGRILSRDGFEVHVSLGPNEVAKGTACFTESGDFIVHKPMNLRVLAAFLADAHLVIANDCGPMHIACASGATTVGIFGPTNPRCWFCYGGKHQRWIQSENETDPWGGWSNADAQHEWPNVDQVYALAKQVLQA